MLALKSRGSLGGTAYKFCACQRQSFLLTLTLWKRKTKSGCCEELLQAHGVVSVAGL